MLALLGAMTAAGGLFLFLWYRTLVALPVGRQPRFIHAAMFKWGGPVLSLILVGLGLVQLGAVSPTLAVAATVGGGLVGFVLLRLDRYTADMRGIYDRYRRIREENADLAEAEVLFHTARARYPRWSHDRVLELVAAKDIAGLILLIVIKDNGINPISDWELYRSLKLKAERIAGGRG
jgi:hypothetical protein